MKKKADDLWRLVEELNRGIDGTKEFWDHRFESDQEIVSFVLKFQRRTGRDPIAFSSGLRLGCALGEEIARESNE